MLEAIEIILEISKIVCKGIAFHVCKGADQIWSWNSLYHIAIETGQVLVLIRLLWGVKGRAIADGEVDIWLIFFDVLYFGPFFTLLILSFVDLRPKFFLDLLALCLFFRTQVDSQIDSNFFYQLILILN